MQKLGGQKEAAHYGLNVVAKEQEVIQVMFEY
jgi:hypothetical protein